MDALVDDFGHFVFLGGVWHREHFAAEGAGGALPDLLCVVVARGLVALGQALGDVFADRPRALAEAPVVVVFAGAAVHHAFCACGPALDGAEADVGAHAGAG